MICTIGFVQENESKTEIMPSPTFVEIPVLTHRPVRLPSKSIIEPPYYAAVVNSITQNEIDMLASITYLEAGNQSMSGKRAVVEVVLNRVMSDEFPNTIGDVLYQKGQFSPAARIATTTGNKEEYEAVAQTLRCQYPILEGERLFFGTSPRKADYIQIDDHFFC